MAKQRWHVKISTRGSEPWTSIKWQLSTTDIAFKNVAGNIWIDYYMSIRQKNDGTKKNKRRVKQATETREGAMEWQTGGWCSLGWAEVHSGLATLTKHHPL